MTYQNILDICLNNKYKKVVLPLLGTGLYGFDPCDIDIDVIKLLCDKKYYSINIVLVNNNIKICNYYKKTLESVMEQKKFDYFIIDDRLVACRNIDGKVFLFTNNHWKSKPDTYIQNFFDEYERLCKQAKVGEDNNIRIFRISKEHAEKILAKSINEYELLMRD